MKTKPFETDPKILLAEYRDLIKAAMARRFAGVKEIKPTFEEQEAATHLVDLLIASLKATQCSTAPIQISPAAHAFFVRFGDALVPILKDTLGPSATTSFLAEAIDSYWRSVHSISAQNN